MNVYDFDKTIYDGDSTIDFWRYCLKRHPWSIRRIPRTVFSFILFRLGIGSREKFKECFYRFLKDIDNCENEVKAFWDKNMKKIKPWYLSQKNESDLVVSASPEFLISEACKRLNINFIASKVDTKTGLLLSPNCRGEEKVNRVFSEFQNVEIENFYSDSHSDISLAQKSQNAYLVKKNRLIKWEIDFNKQEKL